MHDRLANGRTGALGRKTPGYQKSRLNYIESLQLVKDWSDFKFDRSIIWRLRKTWLCSDTPKGASSSAAIYSIVETAKANGLIYTYLDYLLMYMLDTDWQNDPEDLNVLIP